MFLAEPAQTQFDLRFHVGQIPVRISPFFWLAAVLLRGGGPIPQVLIWVGAVLLSILIHELGHAWAFRHYGISSQIVLYHFGGLAIPIGQDPASGMGRARSVGPRENVIISAAGPLTQILAAVLMMLSLRLAGFNVPNVLGPLDRLLPLADGRPLPSPEIFSFVVSFLIISIYWALLNLLPVYPLDGGQIARNLLLTFGNPDAIKHSLILSVATGGLIAAYGFSRGQTFLGFMFALLAYSSFQMLQAHGGGGGFGRRG